MCMCLALDGVVVGGLISCFTNPVGTGGVWDVYLSFGGVGVELGPRSGRVEWYYACVCFQSELFV